MKVGSLFSGGGLGDYGLELAGMDIAFQVEIDDYCQQVLKQRWPNVPKWKDIREVKI
jgi:DNA (cytosine-5)-methyltransferase 1